MGKRAACAGPAGGGRPGRDTIAGSLENLSQPRFTSVKAMIDWLSDVRLVYFSYEKKEDQVLFPCMFYGLMCGFDEM